MAGAVRGPLRGPFIYAIVTRDLVYIGETQTHPVMRWGSHLQLAGSFRLALAASGDPEVDYFGDISFCAVRCRTVESEFPPSLLKTATQAVEHRLHVTLCRRPGVLGRPLRLISDTEKTAPRRFDRWTLAQDIATAVLDGLRLQLEPRWIETAG